jgi:polyhydroxyalkanoate synthase subunit PhaC
MLCSGNNNISKIYSSHIQVLQNIFYNSLYFFNNYHLLYLNSLNQYMTYNTNNFNQNKAFQWGDATSFFSSFSYFPYYYINKWLKATDEEANRLLKSQHFLDNFREYIKSIIKYEMLLKEESNNNNNPFFSINDLDKITDRFQDYLNKEFIPFIFNQQTPHKVVLQMDTFRLLKYNNQIDNKFRKSELKVRSQQQQKMNQDNIPSPQLTPPILMVYAPINRYHVLDINQKRSIVKQFLSKGFDVFLIDWGSQITEQIDNKSPKLIEDYISFIDKSIHKIKELTKSNTINLYGYSWGGLLCTLYTSFQNFNKNIQNLILHSSPLDFSKDNTIIAEWLRKFPNNEYIEQYKEMHGSLIDISFLMRNPFKHNFDSLRYALAMQIDSNTNSSIYNVIKENYQNIDLIQLFADIIRLRTWITNTPDLPGEFFKQFVDYFYCENAIITNYNKNETQLLSNLTNENRNTNTNIVSSKNLNKDDNNKSYFPSIEKIIEEMDLNRITMPTLSIVGKNDDLISYDSSISINKYISASDKNLIEFPGDHIELCISYNAHREIWPKVVEWLAKRSIVP